MKSSPWGMRINGYPKLRLPSEGEAYDEGQKQYGKKTLCSENR